MNDTDTAPSQELSLAQALRVGMRVLGHDVRLWATLLLSFSLFAWALMAPADWRIMAVRLVGAAVFCLLVHVPFWKKKESAG